MFLHSVHLRVVLSFRDTKVELKKLNVLIGANGSGKSNFVDTLSLLAGFTADSEAFFRSQGGAGDWISKAQDAGRLPQLIYRFGEGREYEVSFVSSGPSSGPFPSPFSHVYTEDLRSSKPRVVALSRNDSVISGRGPLATHFRNEQPDMGRSVLSYLFPARSGWREWQEQLRAISTYRLAGLREIRQGVPITGSSSRYLAPTGDNLAKMIYDFYQAGLLDGIDAALKRFGEGYSSIKAEIFGPYWGLRLSEDRLEGSVSATRISDGTLRFLQLLVILRHPDPPPLIVIEEPELGLHPDAIGIIADELMEASERTQIVVTTHSPELLKSLQQVPDCVLVCEKDFDNATSIRRLDPKSTRLWLEEFSSLGELWRSGAIGGNRW